MNSRYMHQLDGFRFIAVTGVMCGHWLVYSDLKYVNAFLAGNGVNLFFVLSGFLITQILIQEKKNASNSTAFTLRQFYIRRFLRIFPLYYLVITLAILLKVPTARENFIWYVTYTTNILVGLNGGNCGYFTHLWSLAVEEQFYIIFPFIVLLIPVRHLFKSFIIIGLLAVLSRALIYFFFNTGLNVEWSTYTWTSCCFDSFAIGAILAYLKVFEADRLLRLLARKYTYLLFLVFTIIIFAIYILYPTYGFLTHLFIRLTFSIFCFGIIGIGAFSLYKGGMKFFLENKVVIYLGKITYGLYVFHHFMPFIFNLFGYDSSKYQLITSATFYFIATVIISSISWYFFEKPINNLKKFFDYQILTPVTVKSTILDEQ